MTTEIIKAAAQARGFYDTPLYREGEEKPDYYDLFEWSHSSFGYGAFGGILKEELFDSIEKKVAYIRGIFEDPSEGWGVIRGENFITFANSQEKAERCKKWINEICRFMLDGKTISSENKNTHLINLIHGGVIRHEIKYCLPICHRIDLQSEVVKFIQNFGKFEPIDRVDNDIDWTKPIAAKDGKFVNSDDGVMVEEIDRVLKETLFKLKKDKDTRCT